MAVRYKTTRQNNEIYFITFTILDWQPIFINDQYCSLVYRWFDYLKNSYGNKLYGYAIMPNHIHCLIKLSDQSPDVSVMVREGKRFLAYAIAAKLKEDGRQEILNHFKTKADTKNKANYKVFNTRFDSLVIQSRKFFLQKLNYLHFNPCQKKWQLADKPENYKHSSAANYILGTGCYKVEAMDF